MKQASPIKGAQSVSKGLTTIMIQLPAHLWNTILEYLAEREHRYDLWLWQSRLVCREINKVASSMIWKRTKVTIGSAPGFNSEKPLRLHSRSFSIREIVKAALEQYKEICRGDRHNYRYRYIPLVTDDEDTDDEDTDGIVEESDNEVSDDGEPDDGGLDDGEPDDGEPDDGEPYFEELNDEEKSTRASEIRPGWSRLDGGDRKEMQHRIFAYEVLDILQAIVDSNHVENHLSIRNHIALARVEMDKTNWTTDHLSDLANALIAKSKKMLSEKVSTAAMIFALEQEFEGYMRTEYYSNDISNGNIYWMLDQVMQNKHAITELEVVVESLSYVQDDEVYKSYMELCEVLSNCSSLKMVKITINRGLQQSIQITKHRSSDRGSAMVIPLDERAHDYLTIPLKNSPVVHLESPCIPLDPSGFKRLDQASRIEELTLDRVSMWGGIDVGQLGHLKVLSIAIGSDLPWLPDTLETLHLTSARYGECSTARQPTRITARNLRLLHVEEGYETLFDAIIACYRVKRVIVDGYRSRHDFPPKEASGPNPFPQLEKLDCLYLDQQSVKYLLEWLKPSQCLDVTKIKRYPLSFIDFLGSLPALSLVLHVDDVASSEFSSVVKRLLKDGKEVLVKKTDGMNMRILGIPEEYQVRVRMDSRDESAYIAISSDYVNHELEPDNAY